MHFARCVTRRPRDTLYPQKLVLTSQTSGGRSVGIVYSRTQATEFSIVYSGLCDNREQLKIESTAQGRDRLCRAEDVFPIAPPTGVRRFFHSKENALCLPEPRSLENARN
jgi:hypothetical protein